MPNSDGEPILELKKVGQYDILAPVGQGGMGRVYKAIDKEKDRIVAIKVLRREFSEDRKKRRADYLGRENRIASTLDHPNVIDIFEIFEEPDDAGRRQRYLLMEYIDGVSLRHFIKERDWPLDEGLAMFQDICKGLDYIHHLGIVHRDVKPENFLIAKTNNAVKIADFGLSLDNRSWRTRNIKARTGTPRYMSPEQIAGKNLDFRSDIFSLGLTMYELFSGTYPFEGADRVAVMKQIMNPRIRIHPPIHFNHDLPSDLSRIIMKMMRWHPRKRYQMVTEIILEINRITRPRI
ncbi:serine/threonine protein kinase [Candidatus Hydrogenedentota bacterium]